jgi:ubiquinone/menaquinone biosynthesis C-methylase UbiE
MPARPTIERIYDPLARIHDLWADRTHLLSRQRAPELARVQPGEPVLEVAVGTGRFFAQLATLGELKRLVGVELSREMLRRARTTQEAA